MITRRTSRRWAVQILYSLELNKVELQRAFLSFWEANPCPVPDRSFTEDLVTLVCDHLEDVDRVLGKSAKNWDVSRMPPVDRSILRLATAELTLRADIPAAVSIDEAVELAKELSAENASRFVNGVLDRIRTDSERSNAQR